mmetsp:Transcript_17528/g.54485  ORF Transcript_17528/g.54485 Transcript_17528/m.54485 type:complete len:282 (-) Transcript_17528:447-1292(-)
MRSGVASGRMSRSIGRTTCASSSPTPPMRTTAPSGWTTTTFADISTACGWCGWQTTGGLDTLSAPSGVTRPRAARLPMSRGFITTNGGYACPRAASRRAFSSPSRCPRHPLSSASAPTPTPTPSAALAAAAARRRLPTPTRSGWTFSEGTARRTRSGRGSTWAAAQTSCTALSRSSAARSSRRCSCSRRTSPICSGPSSRRPAASPNSRSSCSRTTRMTMACPTLNSPLWTMRTTGRRAGSSMRGRRRRRAGRSRSRAGILARSTSCSSRRATRASSSRSS